jgi:tetratricopeptide (TPR) repeat protein
MRNSHLVLAAALATCLSSLPGFAQTAGGTQTADPMAAYQRAIQSRDWPGAVAAAQQLVNQSPTSANLVLRAKAQRDSRSGEAALATFERAIAAAKAEQPAAGSGDPAMARWKDGLAEIYLSEGSALLFLKRTPEAIAAYNTAAQYASHPSLAYFNICALYYNSGDMNNAVSPCRKSVQADPARANAWFILGSVLFGNSPLDAKGSPVFSPDVKQALDKYLELAPDGPHASDVKAMLSMMAK